MHHTYKYVYGKDDHGGEGFILTNISVPDYPNAVSNGLLFAHDVYEHVYGRVLTIEDELMALGGLLVIRGDAWDWGLRSTSQAVAEEVLELLEFCLARGVKELKLKLNTEEKELISAIQEDTTFPAEYTDDVYYKEHWERALRWVIQGRRIKLRQYRKQFQKADYYMVTAFRELQEYMEQQFKWGFMEGESVTIINKVASQRTVVHISRYDECHSHVITY